MPTYYYAQGGSAANKEAATSGIYPGGCMSPAVADSESAGFSPGDFCLASDGGGVIRALITARSSGAIGSVITWGAKSGDTPELRGSDLVTGFSVDVGDRYKTAAVITTEPKQVFIDGVYGDRKTSVGACVDDYDWYWAADILYLYDSAGNPDVRNSPGIEISQRGNSLVYNSKEYLTFDGLIISHANDSGLNSNASSHIVIENCTLEWNFGCGTEASTGSGTYSDYTIQDNVIRYNGKQGILFTNSGDGFSDMLIRRNSVYLNGTYQTEGASTWTGGLKFYGGVGSTTENCVIEQNVFYSNGFANPLAAPGVNKGMGVWMDYVYATLGNENIIRHNLIYDNRSCAVFIEASDFTKVYGNLGWDNAQGTTVGEFTASCIRLDSRASQTGNSNLFYNNTFIGGLRGIVALTYSQAGGCEISDNIFKNNVLVGQSGYVLYCDEGGDNDEVNGTGNVYDKNCFGAERENFIWWTDTAHDTYVDWENDHGEAWTQIEEDPSFTDADGNDYSHMPGSSCINLGVELGPPYNIALMPETQAADFPDSVVTGSQDDY